MEWGGIEGGKWKLKRREGELREGDGGDERTREGRKILQLRKSEKNFVHMRKRAKVLLEKNVL